MALFEDYRQKPRPDERREALVDVLIRPAVKPDVVALAAMESTREGGNAAQHARQLETSISSWCSRGEGLILVVEHRGRPLGLAKVRHFNPPEDTPLNMAPRGWYLAGVVVRPEWRCRGLGRRLTQARLSWIAERAHRAYYFANARNRVTIELHEPFGFVELTRDFTYPGVTFEGGEGILFTAEIRGR